MCYPAYIHHVLNYTIVFNNNICRLSTRRPVFDIDNMFGEKDFIGLSLNSSYTIDHLFNFQITRNIMAYRWKVGSIAVYLICAPLCSPYSVVS